jgi:hypothetical protein
MRAIAHRGLSRTSRRGRFRATGNVAGARRAIIATSKLRLPLVPRVAETSTHSSDNGDFCPVFVRHTAGN